MFMQKNISTETTKLNDEINFLKDQFNKIQAQFITFKKSTPWYKNHSINLSIITFALTFSLSLYTFSINQTNAEKGTYTNSLNNIASQINDLKNFEKDYYQQQSSTSIDNNTKSLLSGICLSKVNQITDDISKKMRNETYSDLEVSLLNDYARYIQQIGNISEAINVNQIALKGCNEKYTKITILRSLANLYSQPGETQNVNHSRKLRGEALKLTKSYSGEYAIYNTMQSFILWANDEYVNANNKDFANSLLDSATYYANRLQ